MRILLHSLLTPASWKAHLSSLLVHGGVLAACFVWLATPVQHTSFSGRRNTMQMELAMQPVPAETAPQPVSIETAVPMELPPLEPPTQAAARSLAPQPTSVRPEPPLPSSLAQLTEVTLHTFEAAPELNAPTPPRRQTLESTIAQQPPTPQPPRPLERKQEQVTPPQPAAAAAVQEIAGVDDRTPPDFANNPPPVYPSLALQMRQQGTVLLELYVSETGKVERVELLRSSGHDILDQAAIDAVQRWQGQPAQERGVAVGTVEQLPIRFIL